MASVWKQTEQVYNLFEDEISKRIFEEKINWMYLGEGIDKTPDYLYEIYPSSRILALEKYKKGTKYAICGAGRLGEATYKALCHAGYDVYCFVDNSEEKIGTLKFGVPVMSFAEFCMKQDGNVVAILDNMGLAEMFFRELCELGFPQSQIYRTTENVVRTAFGNIYFDLPELQPTEKEIFLDAGSYNGENTKEFIKWCNGNYEKVYAFEPMKEGILMTENALRDIPRVEIHKCALSNYEGEAMFQQSYWGLMGSRLGESGDHVEKVHVRTIDNVLNGTPATFIKMDIEGAELDALKGAIHTLQTYKPRLAISLYHNNKDIIDIPLWLKEAVPEYSFYLRHYSNKRWDLVLYCV